MSYLNSSSSSLDFIMNSPPRVDRFIPTGDGSSSNLSHHLITADTGRRETQENAAAKPVTPIMYKNLANSLMNDGQQQEKILAFKQKAPVASESSLEGVQTLYSCTRKKVKRAKSVKRVVPQQPEVVLDAPGLVDNYYYNLLDWGAKDIVAIALKNEVFLWCAKEGSIQQITCSTPNYDVSSVCWSNTGDYLAVGSTEKKIMLYDSQCNPLRTLSDYPSRVSCLAWNEHILTAAGEAGVVYNYDVRKKDALVYQYLPQNASTGSVGHSGEICGLKYNSAGVLASGGNDNIVCIWDVRTIGQSHESSKPMHQLQSHTAAVKALAWAPFQQNLLATGGGTADRCIRFWNTTSGTELSCIDSGSQVCSLQWAKNDTNELISSHGYSKNQLSIWKYPSGVKVCDDLVGHRQRVLHMCLSPDGTRVATAAGDETLRFWKVFEAAPKQRKKAVGGSGSRRIHSQIR